MDDERTYIKQMADILGRKAHTIRQWIRDDALPSKLRPHRDERGRLYWRPSQIDPLKSWALERAKRQGWPSRAA